LWEKTRPVRLKANDMVCPEGYSTLGKKREKEMKNTLAMLLKKAPHSRLRNMF
jgi:hypothetical protein